ncbi:MAG TPA: T9SS type A sorting domain-containing protein [Draconibacterium sp.]|nr:T9SS type A sorting domain-containing protein [Draconibacterium sp.]
MALARKSILLVAVTFFCLSIAAGQSAITTSGGNISGNDGSVSFTAGQVFYRSLLSPVVNLVEGVQQPFEISTLTSIDYKGIITLEYIIYPNPTMGSVTLTIKPNHLEKMRFQLFDSNGNLLQNKMIESESTEISTESLPAAIYFLDVIIDNQKVKAFKIIKN